MSARKDHGHIQLVGRNAGDESYCTQFACTTSNAHHDTFVMTSCLELEQAARRGVRFSPLAVGSLIVVGPNVSLLTLIRGWFKQRSRARATIAKIKDAALASQQPDK